MFSRDCIIASARNPGIGEPVSVILIYLFTLPLNLKHLYMRNALKKRLNFNVRGDSTKEYFAELEHAVKWLGFLEDTTSEVVHNVLRSRPSNAL